MKKLTAILLSAIIILGILSGCVGLSPDNIGNIADDIIQVIEDSGEEIKTDSDLPVLPDDGSKTTATEHDSDTDGKPENAGSEPESAESGSDERDQKEKAPDRDGFYYSRDDVALYIHTYGELPPNYITKKQAEKLGWTGGSIDKYMKGGAIGGTYFGNYEGVLPDAEGRKWTECDIDTDGKSSRGAKRIVFSNDGLIYYTEDHYESFTLLYTKEGPAK